MSKVFAARFHGECPVCMDDIVPGDDVCYVPSGGDDDDELIHAECREPVNLDTPPREERSPFKKSPFTKPKTTPDEVCPICNMDHVGECL